MTTSGFMVSVGDTEIKAKDSAGYLGCMLDHDLSGGLIPAFLFKNNLNKPLAFCLTTVQQSHFYDKINLVSVAHLSVQERGIPHPWFSFRFHLFL